MSWFKKAEKEVHEEAHELAERALTLFELSHARLEQAVKLFEQAASEAAEEAKALEAKAAEATAYAEKHKAVVENLAKLLGIGVEAAAKA